MAGKRRERKRIPSALTTYGVDYFMGAELGLPKKESSPITVFNAQTRQYEEIPLTQFQQLLREGKIEESVSRSPYDGHSQRTYRLV